MTASPTTRFLALALSIGSFTILQSLLVPVLPLIQADFHTDTEGHLGDHRLVHLSGGRDPDPRTRG